jgi:hypothetical protein
MTKNKWMVVCGLVSSMALVACYNDASTMDDGEGGSGATSSNGGSDPDGCSNADEGDDCSGEGSECGDLVCHCGDWLDEDDSDLDDECSGNTDDCDEGDSCSTDGATCDGLVCCNGRWDDNCDNTGGNGSGGNGNGGTYSVNIKVHSYSYHLYCEGAEVEPYTGEADGEIEWFGPWQSLGGDVFGPEMPAGQHPGEEWLTYEVNVEVDNDHGLRIQCYLNTNGNETEGDIVRYAFSDPEMFENDEYVEIRRDGNIVYDLADGDTGSGNTPDAYLAENLDPQHFSHNLQIDPP